MLEGALSGSHHPGLVRTLWTLDTDETQYGFIIQGICSGNYTPFC